MLANMFAEKITAGKLKYFKIMKKLFDLDIFIFIK